LAILDLTVSGPTDRRYDPHAVEARRQASWAQRDAFRTPALDDERAHLYIKPSAPFTSGNVHIGHVRSYSVGDAYARYRRARGEDVLFAFGFDAFGLPAELGAIAGGESPSDWVARCATHMKEQLLRLGFSLDWERAFLSSDAVMYRWSQWLFLVLLEAGLVYRGTGTVDWCDNCQTTLASIQVEAGGTCWRCHNPVRLVELPQWYFRVSAYVEENDRRLGEREGSGKWDKLALDSQLDVLGRVDGVEVELSGSGGEKLTAFTPHAEALAGARFVMVSPRHPQAEAWAADAEIAARLEQMRSGGWERSARDAEAIPLIDTGASASGLGEEPLPVVISPVVDARFGTTIALGIPAADKTDAVLARRLGLPGVEDLDEDGDGAAANGRAPTGRPAVRYKASDWVISRQRSWGSPIPIVYCERDGAVPVPTEQLPVVLPLDIRPTGTGNPLAEDAGFVETTCPRCGGPARRETDTLDCHFDALWLWVPACVPPEARELPLEEIFALADLRHWLPSERLVAGSDSGNFVFDQRTVTKALRDIGPLAFLADGEPFAGCLFHEMVIRDGRKMSKHLGNVVDPDELVKQYGADTVRLAVLYAARAQKQLNWSDSAVTRCHRFLAQVWDFTVAKLAQSPEPVEKDTSEHLRKKLAQWCEAAVERTTAKVEELEMHAAVENVMRLFDRIKDFEKRVLAREPALGAANLEALTAALAVLVQMLGPFAPHIAEELWIALGGDDQVTQTPWPGVEFRVPA
jgi:leucyl-tRNA synthetase